MATLNHQLGTDKPALTQYKEWVTGVVHGTTDKTAAFPVDHPVSAGDLVATVYHLVGVDPEATVPDHTGRPTHISHGGKPIAGVLN